MKAIIIDVRTTKEFSEAALPGAINLPATHFQVEDYQPYRHHHICLVCESGNRAQKVRQKLMEAGFSYVSIMEKNMEELRTKVNVSSGWGIDRQFRLALAILIGLFLLGHFMGVTISFSLPIIVFSGLLYSAVTDNCYLKELIARFPWNKQQAEIA